MLQLDSDDEKFEEIIPETGLLKPVKRYVMNLLPIHTEYHMNVIHTYKKFFIYVAKKN